MNHTFTTPDPLLPVIGITMGDPVGIGPEIIARMYNDPQLYNVCRPIVVGDREVMQRAMALFDFDININCVTDPGIGIYKPGNLDMISISSLDAKRLKPGKPSRETGIAMQEYILAAIDLAVQQKISGVCTCPITKTAMKLAESSFHGHTELFAHKTKTSDYAMMLAGSRLKVVLVTIHMPLADVSGSLSIENIFNTIKLTHQSLKDRFHLPHPRVGVAGFNPHAGEDSMFGHEEETLITPAVSKAVQEGVDATGPLPPDTIFNKAADGQFDAVVCMYHDQGLIPFKLLHFKDGVNTTLGLPIIRTSVDHGTAYDIAWQKKADATSLFEAVKMAAFQACPPKS